MRYTEQETLNKITYSTHVKIQR